MMMRSNPGPVSEGVPLFLTCRSTHLVRRFPTLSVVLYHRMSLGTSRSDLAFLEKAPLSCSVINILQGSSLHKPPALLLCHRSPHRRLVCTPTYLLSGGAPLVQNLGLGSTNP
jgi:hypothetical protein